MMRQLRWPSLVRQSRSRSLSTPSSAMFLCKSWWHRPQPRKAAMPLSLRSRSTSSRSTRWHDRWTMLVSTHSLCEWQSSYYWCCCWWLRLQRYCIMVVVHLWSQLNSVTFVIFPQLCLHIKYLNYSPKNRGREKRRRRWGRRRGGGGVRRGRRGGEWISSQEGVRKIHS